MTIGQNAECRDYWVKQNENFGAFRQQVDDWMALAEHRVLQASLRGGSDLLISPEDSVSCIGSHAQSSSSKRSKNHSRVEALLYFIKSMNLLLILVCGVERWTYS